MYFQIRDPADALQKVSKSDTEPNISRYIYSTLILII